MSVKGGGFIILEMPLHSQGYHAGLIAFFFSLALESLSLTSYNFQNGRI